MQPLAAHLKLSVEIIMNSWITITRYPYEEPYQLNLLMTASNGRQLGEIEFYINTDDLNEIADILEEFPRHASDVYLYELGSERSEDRCAYYFRFRLCTIDLVGHCAIHLRFNNNLDIPDREITEFCIPAEPFAINRLGNFFREFAQLKHEVLYWSPVESKLYKTQKEVEQAHPVIPCFTRKYSK